MKERRNSSNKISFVKDIIYQISLKTQTSTIFRYFLIVFAYTLLTILLTYPVAFTIGTNVPGRGDAFQWMNMLWYTNFALSHPELTSLTHENMVFYPTGIPAMPFPSAFNQIITLLLLPLCQIHIIYSIIWLLSFILAAFGTFLLVRYLTQNDYAAFLSGIIFAFTPFHLVHGLEHMGATTIQWIPFCALFFMKVFREGGIKNCILAGIFYILVAMSDMQYMIFMGIFIAVLFLYEHFISLQENKGVNIETHKSILIKYLIIGIVAFSIILPLTITDLQTATSGNNLLKPNPLEAVTYSTDLLSFFLPSPIHSIFGAMVKPIYHNFTGNYSEHTTYIGYTVLFLSIFALFVFRKDLTVRFWGIIALFYLLLSMGPVLHVAGKTVFTVFKISVPLPHLILYYLVPFLDNSRTTGRFFIVAALAFTVLAGYGCSELIKRYDTKKIFIVTLLCAFIIFEYMSIPFPTSPVDQPAFYQNIGQDPDHYALLEIPITANYSAGVNIIYYQTIHGKPVVGGQAPRIPLNAWDFERNTPFINEITFLKPINDILIQEKNSTSISVLRYYNIRYILLHKKYLHPNDLIFAQDRINQLNTSIKKIVENKEYIVYWVEDGPYQEFLLISDGWNALEQWKDGPGRWMRKDARIIIISPEDRDYLLSFEVGGLWKNRDLSVYINNELVQKFLINTTGNRDITPDRINIPIHANKGENIVKFSTSLPGSIPSEIGAWNDKRELSLAFQKIQIRPIFIHNNTHDYKTEYLEKSHDNLTFKAHLIDDTISESEENGNYLFAIINITNQGIDTWNVNNPNPVYLSYHWLHKNQPIVFDGIRTSFPSDIKGGQSIRIKMIVKTPDVPGNYTLVIDLVKEGITWFENQNTTPLEKQVQIIPRTPIIITNFSFSTSDSTLNGLKDFLLSTMNSSAVTFSGKTGTVNGFTAGTEYPQIWIRDSATILPFSRFLSKDEYLRSWIEEFIIHQEKNGSIYDYVSPIGMDKNTVATDQETSLVHSAYLYYSFTKNDSWLLKKINEEPIIDHLERSMVWILKNRFNEKYQLVTGAYTADWGDVQFEDIPGTDITDKTHYTCDVYDNALFYRACVEIADMQLALGNYNKSKYWNGMAESIRTSINTNLWDNENGYYKMHILLFEDNDDYNDNHIFAIGGNSMALLVGCANESQVTKIITNAIHYRELSNTPSIGGVLYPPYPDGFFMNPIMDQEYEYQNGGQWDWFAGRFILAEYKHGFSKEATQHLKEIALQALNNGGLYEWYTPEGAGKGSKNYTGSAGVLGECIIEGYFGISLSNNTLSVSPRLGYNNGSIILAEPTSGTVISYNYRYIPDNECIFEYQSNYPDTLINIMIPQEPDPKELIIDGKPCEYSIISFENEKYISFKLIKGTHNCSLIL